MTFLTSIPPRRFCLVLIAMSGLALGAVFIGQYGFGLHPCHLCVYQRWPFGIVIGLGIIGFFSNRFTGPAFLLSGVTLLVNAGIALYHSGVERKWWTGLEGCSTPDMTGSIDELMKRISETAVTRCDEIAWQMFGLSLANYTLLFCLALAGATFLYRIKARPA